MEILFFLLFSFVAIASAILVVSLKNVMHCALFLALFLFSIAGMFFILDADFLGIVQILLYIGGIVVLILFAVMLTARVSSHLLVQTNEQKFISIIICFILCIFLGYLIVTYSFVSLDKQILKEGITKDIGRLLIAVYVLPFEIASVVLLVSLIGAMVLIGKKGEE
ncbi:MAG: NADH-quinone oxidoreductase subunit J [Candidatus Firestonebacteria bacterium]